MDLYLFDDGETGLELDMIRLSIVFLASISRAILFVFVLFCFCLFSSLVLWFLWVCGFCGFTMLCLLIYVSNLT